MEVQTVFIRNIKELLLYFEIQQYVEAVKCRAKDNKKKLNYVDVASQTERRPQSFQCNKS